MPALFPLLLVTHIVLAVSLFLPSILLPFALRTRRAAADSPHGLVRFLLWMQAHGTLVIVRHEQGYELLPRVAADKVRDRDAGMIVLDHAPRDQAEAAASGSAAEADDYYRQFPVPDDLVW